MKLLDRQLQKYRADVARQWILKGSRVLDLGCFKGEFLDTSPMIAQDSIGVEPLAKKEMTSLRGFKIYPGKAPEIFSYRDLGRFDAITLLAVYEHLDANLRQGLGNCLLPFLNPSGRVIITVPSPAVDWILKVLLFFKQIEGMSLEEHHGVKPGSVPTSFDNRSYSLLCYRRFQLGLNNLFVFQKSSLFPQSLKK